MSIYVDVKNFLIKHFDMKAWFKQVRVQDFQKAQLDDAGTK